MSNSEQLKEAKMFATSSQRHLAALFIPDSPIPAPTHCKRPDLVRPPHNCQMEIWTTGKVALFRQIQWAGKCVTITWRINSDHAFSGMQIESLRAQTMSERLQERPINASSLFEPLYTVRHSICCFSACCLHHDGRLTSSF